MSIFPGGAGLFDFSHLAIATVVTTSIHVGLSAIGCVVAFYQRGGGRFRQFLAFAFPRKLVTTWSCYQDAGFILLKQLIRPFVTMPILLLASTNCAFLTYSFLGYMFGPRPERPVSAGLFVALLLAAVLIQDFFRYLSHCLMHRASVFWDFHKVHHSAKYLTPLTNHRSHAIEELIQQAATGISVGPFLALAAFATSTSISTTSLLGFDAYLLIDALSFAMLRHSHIGLSFGRFERFIMSPKQHHLHHSVNERHWDKNFGFLFACWDRMAGSFCYSDPREDLTFGISDEEHEDYDSVLKLHFMPYIKLIRRIFPSAGRGEMKAGSPLTDLHVEPAAKV